MNIKTNKTLNTLIIWLIVIKKLNGYGYVHAITCATGCIKRGVRYIVKARNEESFSIIT